MRALACGALLLFLVALVAGVEAGRACSCALPDARAALAQSDGAFVGRLVSRREADQRAILTFSVERTLKGSIGSTVEVVTASNGAACGIELSPATRTGLVLERRGGAWHGHLCWQFEPAELIAAALPLPPPNGRGPVALVVGGEFGHVRLLALDALGRTLAYGRGSGRAGLLSVCPGGQRLVELAYTGARTTLVVRATRTLRILGRQRLSLPRQRYAQHLRCEHESGGSAILFARGPGDSPVGSALYRLSFGRLAEIWSGPAYYAEVSATHAYLSAGMAGTRLLRVALVGTHVTQVATLPGPASALALNAAGNRLAGVHGRLDRPSEVVRVDLSARPARVTTVSLARAEVYGQVFWLATDRLLFVPAFGGSPARVFDERLHTRARFRWTAGSAARVGGSVFGTDQTASLLRAELPSGPQRVIRRLPGRPTLVVSATR